MKENIYYLSKWWLNVNWNPNPKVRSYWNFNQNDIEKYTSKIIATSPKA